MNPLPLFVQGSMGQREPEYLAWTSIVIALGIKSYVELGSTFGSANFMHQAGVEKVVSVDLLHDRDTEFNEAIRYFKMDSHDPATLKTILDYLGGPPEAVFIDADHDGDAPRKDFDLWWPVVTKVCGFHDILIPNIENDLWPDVSRRFPSVGIIARDSASAIAWQGPGAPTDGKLSGGGIGVLFKPRS